MNHLLDRFIAILTLSILVAAAVPARAQFEIVAGSADCREAAYKGVQELNGTTCSGAAGVIAAGVSLSNGTGCGDADVYVVHYSLAGAIIWDNTYDINGAGNNDSALSVTQVDDGFVVVGITDQGSGNTDIFIMKLDCYGAVSWVRTYGDEREDFAMDVKIATTGNGSSTNAGDILVCGWTMASDQMVWGYLLRTTSTGVIVWDQYYTVGLPHYGGRMHFNSLVEATVVGAESTGDIVAVGMTDIVGPAPPTPPKSVEAIAIRVNGDNGGLTLPRHSFAAYGGNNLEDFWGVIEHTGDIDAGGIPDLIFVGKATFPTGTGFTSDVYVVNCPGSPCSTPNAEAFYGDGATGTDWEQAHSVFEASGFGPPNAGDIAMTGFTIPISQFFIDWDAFLLVVPAALNAAPTLSRKYGSVNVNNDVGNSIWEISSGGWLIAGATASNLRNATPVDPEDMYLLGTNGAGKTGDCSFDWPAIRNSASYGADCYTVTPTDLDLSTTADADEIGPLDPVDICPRPTSRPKVRGSIGPGESNAHDRQAFAYPNPVRRGSEVRTGVDISEGSIVTVVVTNVTGQVVYRRVVEAGQAAATVSVPTSGLANGVYTVVVGDGIRSELWRFSVTD